MRRRGRRPAPEEEGCYRDCFVAFLDILGFGSLVARSLKDGGLLAQLAGLTRAVAGPRSGVKGTSLGPCLVQTRAFSDCIVVFVPMTSNTPAQAEANPLAQLLFLARYLHDRVLELGACLRGAVTAGPMYWDPSWNRTSPPGSQNGASALPIAFGPGLINAYLLERDVAEHPRVVISSLVVELATKQNTQSWPFADANRSLASYFISDESGVHFLGLLDPEVTRKRNEQLVTSNEGFSIEWTDNESALTRVVENCRKLIDKHRNVPEPNVRSKYQWLERHLDGLD